jgi:hypothetical protein
MTEPKIERCSFCGKTQHEVTKLIAGPDVHICNECTELCAQICGTVVSIASQPPRVKVEALQLAHNPNDLAGTVIARAAEYERWLSTPAQELSA